MSQEWVARLSLKILSQHCLLKGRFLLHCCAADRSRSLRIAFGHDSHCGKPSHSSIRPTGSFATTIAPLPPTRHQTGLVSASLMMVEVLRLSYRDRAASKHASLLPMSWKVQMMGGSKQKRLALIRRRPSDTVPLLRIDAGRTSTITPRLQARDRLRATRRACSHATRSEAPSSASRRFECAQAWEQNSGRMSAPLSPEDADPRVQTRCSYNLRARNQAY